MHISELEQVENLLQIGKYVDALQIIQSKDLDKLDTRTVFLWQVIKAKCLNKMGQYKQTIDLLMKIQNHALLQSDINLQIQYTATLINAYLRHGDTDLGYYYILELEKLSAADNLELRAIIYKFKAMYAWFIGDLDQASLAATQSLNTYQQLSGKDHEIAFILNLKGICLMRLGYLQQAEPQFAESYAIFTFLQDHVYAAIALANHGSALLQIGELDSALQKLETSLAIFQQENSLRHYADTLRSIGQVYQRMNKIEDALNYVKESLSVRVELGNTLEIGESLFWLVLLHLDNDDVAAAEIQFSLLEDLHRKHNNSLLDIRYDLAHAMLLKAYHRIKDLADAQSILERITATNVKDHELTVLALLNYLELLVTELNLVANSAIITDIATITARLISIAQQQNSSLLLSEIYWLQARIAHLQYDFNTAKDYFTQAQEIADRHNFIKLAMQISHDYDTFLDETHFLDASDVEHLSIAERANYLAPKLVSLSEDIKYRKELYKVDVATEEPIKLMLLAPESGITYYTYDFSDVQVYDTLLMGNFLQAIQGFSSAMFSRKIDRLKIGEYNLIISVAPYAMICYIYKGASYLSEKKIRKFMQILDEDSATTSRISELFSKGIYLTPDLVPLDSTVESIFL